MACHAPQPDVERLCRNRIRRRAFSRHISRYCRDAFSKRSDERGSNAQFSRYRHQTLAQLSHSPLQYRHFSEGSPSGRYFRFGSWLCKNAAPKTESGARPVRGSSRQAPERVDRPNWIVFVDPVFQTFRKERRLAPIHPLDKALHPIPRKLATESYRGTRTRWGVFTQPGSAAAVVRARSFVC
jgi:hypothetical protein